MSCWHKLEPRKVGDKFVADAGADFVACMQGEYVAIECKATDQDRFKRSEVSQVQAAHLDAVPLSFLALRIGAEMFFVPWRAIPWETLRTAESVTTDRLRAWEVRSWMGVRECLCFDADGG
jgi:Holliday junction resolvase